VKLKESKEFLMTRSILSRGGGAQTVYKKQSYLASEKISYQKNKNLLHGVFSYMHKDDFSSWDTFHSQDFQDYLAGLPKTFFRDEYVQFLQPGETTQ
jgi:hypothetical protein